ncbi:hypothetical protein [Streptomyces sp. NBC_00385]|uniref:hypothetical protein n=1 Tax=Streptomyces sp. NBC_00385 TaxID=2975733 RepID=UPI002DD8B583|nr:hypothetical protein [Streptomyces sp. NBC_00385]WRZ03873.1 hypothetical protein OG959_11185 [Streptomyces sp. NBC_00385]
MYRKEAASKNRLVALINIALGKVVAAGLKLPTLSAFDTMTFTSRIEVNTSIWCGIHDRMSLAERARMPQLPGCGLCHMMRGVWCRVWMRCGQAGWTVVRRSQSWTA